MRVITGSAKGKRLLTPEGLETRPTIERVKEAIFSSLYSKVTGAELLDLFAGSGQMGIEALSRGAKSAIFVESNRKTSALIKQNLKNTGFEEKGKVINQDAFKFLENIKPYSFDLIFLDPPYGKNLINLAVEKIEKLNILKSSGVIVCESDSTDILKESFGNISLYKRAKYGRVIISYYEKTGEE